ncbi:unnamed protein product [Strongylus vulgaris]|uniref:Uncharacterized protein n=1 Tax=Strongylus vulgaris TaxID=40348 RepID=A0A3P7K5X9_STRVU|nr:unnamed protein product [Strongylus vulgaris]
MFSEETFPFLSAFFHFKCYGTPTSTLQQSLDLSSKVLNLVVGKFPLLRGIVNKLKQGIQNVRNIQIKDEEIASLEPKMLELMPRVSKVVNNPSLLNRVGLKGSLAILSGFNKLGAILPADERAFKAKVKAKGVTAIIAPAISEISRLENTLGL